MHCLKTSFSFRPDHFWQHFCGNHGKYLYISTKNKYKHNSLHTKLNYFAPEYTGAAVNFSQFLAAPYIRRVGAIQIYHLGYWISFFWSALLPSPAWSGSPCRPKISKSWKIKILRPSWVCCTIVYWKNIKILTLELIST